MITAQSQFETAQIYHAANSLDDLKLKGKDDSPEAIREAAKQFESIFTGMMLKSMRDANAAIIDEPLLDSASLGMYQDMYDEQLTLSLSSSGSGLGLADILVEQLSGFKDTKSYPEKVTSELKSIDRIPSRIINANLAPLNIQRANAEQISIPQAQSPLLEPATILAKKGNTSEQVVEKTDERGLDFSSPTAFVQSLWPYAKEAANSLLVDPKVLIAQAALETGWGQHVMRTEHGTSSKNLFGIKANQSWEGPITQVTTLELEGGSLKKQRASFRAYESYADSFNDYAQFVNDKPRYEKAREVSSDPKLYAEELQAAGYATDPDYANKIGDIYNSSILNNALKMLVH